MDINASVIFIVFNAFFLSLSTDIVIFRTCIAHEELSVFCVIFNLKKVKKHTDKQYNKKYQLSPGPVFMSLFHSCGLSTSKSEDDFNVNICIVFFSFFILSY